MKNGLQIINVQAVRFYKRAGLENCSHLVQTSTGNDPVFSKSFLFILPFKNKN